MWNLTNPCELSLGGKTMVKEHPEPKIRIRLIPRKLQSRIALLAGLCFLLWIGLYIRWRWQPEPELISRWREGGAYPEYFGMRDVRWEPQPTQVYIVEEHHEVVPYWLEAVKMNGGKKATLIHIDGHSDMGYPQYDTHFPFGRMPKTDYEISTLMSQNDNFILSAVAAQLIKTIYFIFPSWTDFDIFASKAHLGIAEMTQGPDFCTCYNASEGECTTTNVEDPMNDTHIKPEQCMHGLPYDYLELIVGRTPGILKYSKKWSLKNMTAIQSELKHHPSATSAEELKTPLILDIDEDFFGVHLPSRNLTDIGFTTEDIALIKTMVYEIFCPKYPSLERTIDEWFKQLTQRLISECLPNISRGDLSCVRALAMEILPTLHSNRKTWLCSDDVKKPFLDLMHYISEHAMTTEKLNGLARTGLCFNCAWSSHLYEPHMHLCVGHNTVNNSIVPEYVPSHSELIKMAANFTRVLMALPYQPITVTICRSSRDGYTPRWLQMRIEAIILGLLKRVFNISQEAIHYSAHLAGGQRGWDKRWQ